MPEQKQKIEIETAYKVGSVFFADNEYSGSQSVLVSNAEQSIFAGADKNNANFRVNNYVKYKLPSLGSQEFGSSSLNNGIKLITGCSDAEIVALKSNSIGNKDKAKFLSYFSN